MRSRAELSGLCRSSAVIVVAGLAFFARLALADELTGEDVLSRPLWSIEKPARPQPPAVRDAGWVRNPIDAFVLQKLEAANILPTPDADKRALIRRVTFDLIGLPPTPEEIDAFLSDNSPDAFEKLVDQLLKSPRYGERWARMWLDLARYAESDGFKSDGTRPHAWRYRDYVIESFNADKPYDQFVREQIAGDELDPEDPAALVATGFNRHWPDEDNARNLVLRRQEILNDITDTTASVFLGLTLACARCHDHKYDPILQKDYYRFQAFFAGVQSVDHATGSAISEQFRERQAAWESATAEIRAEMEAIEQPVVQKMRKDTIDKLVVEAQEALKVAPAERTPLQQQLVRMAETKLEITTEAMVNRMAKDNRERWTKLRDQLKEFDHLKPESTPVAMMLTDVGPHAPKTFLLRRGHYASPEEEIEPGFPTVFDSHAATVSPAVAAGKTTGRRTVLANWIASADNPLTARVMANRLWQEHFGQGLVATSADFGVQGEKPSHPELLDWLAHEFVASGWSLKAMHRLMVTSNTYRQGSREARAFANDGGGAAEFDPAKLDPDNRLLWHMPRRRLEAELIRDAMLAVTGQLNTQMAGPSVHPELPAGVSDRYGWKPSAELSERNRRSIYVFVRRNLRYPFFELFDMPDTNETCARRNRTTTAPQALYVLNSELILDQARALAGRVLRDVGEDREAFVVRSFELTFGRRPSLEEVAASFAFLDRQARIASERPEGAKLALPAPMPAGFDLATGAAVTDFCHALINANEFLYLD